MTPSKWPNPSFERTDEKLRFSVPRPPASNVGRHQIGVYMLDAPQIVQSYEQLTAVIHLTVPRAEIGKVMGPAISEVLSVIARQGVTPNGPCFSYHPKRPTDTFDFEVGFPVSAPFLPVGRVQLSKLPAAKVVRTVYRGGYKGLSAAWAEFCAWMETAGLNPEQGLWECYTSGPESTPDPSLWRTELNCPLKP